MLILPALLPAEAALPSRHLARRRPSPLHIPARRCPSPLPIPWRHPSSPLSPSCADGVLGAGAVRSWAGTAVFAGSWVLHPPPPLQNASPISLKLSSLRPRQRLGVAPRGSSVAPSSLISSTSIFFSSLFSRCLCPGADRRHPRWEDSRLRRTSLAVEITDGWKRWRNDIRCSGTLWDEPPPPSCHQRPNDDTQLQDAHLGARRWMTGSEGQRMVYNWGSKNEQLAVGCGRIASSTFSPCAGRSRWRRQQIRWQRPQQLGGDLIHLVAGQ